MDGHFVFAFRLRRGKRKLPNRRFFPDEPEFQGNRTAVHQHLEPAPVARQPSALRAHPARNSLPRRGAFRQLEGQPVQGGREKIPQRLGPRQDIHGPGPVLRQGGQHFLHQPDEFVHKGIHARQAAGVPEEQRGSAGLIQAAQLLGQTVLLFRPQPAHGAKGAVEMGKSNHEVLGVGLVAHDQGVNRQPQCVHVDPGREGIDGLAAFDRPGKQDLRRGPVGRAGDGAGEGLPKFLDGAEVGEKQVSVQHQNILKFEIPDGPTALLRVQRQNLGGIAAARRVVADDLRRRPVDRPERRGDLANPPQQRGAVEGKIVSAFLPPGEDVAQAFVAPHQNHDRQPLAFAPVDHRNDVRTPGLLRRKPPQKGDFPLQRFRDPLPFPSGIGHPLFRGMGLDGFHRHPQPVGNAAGLPHHAVGPLADARENFVFAALETEDGSDFRHGLFSNLPIRSESNPCLSPGRPNIAAPAT